MPGGRRPCRRLHTDPCSSSEQHVARHHTPTADCTDVAVDPNCKPNQNQKEPSDNSTNLNPDDSLNNPSPQAQDPAVNNNDQTPGSTGSPENASGGNAVSPSGSGNVEGDNAGGAGSAGSSGTNN